MSDFDATVFYAGPGIEHHFDRDVAADASLRTRLGLAEGAAGGLILTDAENRLVIRDDFDHVIAFFLTELPLRLRAGENAVFRDHYGPEGVSVTRSGGLVVFDDHSGETVSGSQEAVLAALDGAKARHAEVMALVGRGA